MKEAAALSWREQWRTFFRIMVLSMGLCNLLASLDASFWFFEFFSHFVVQYLALGIGFSFIALILKQWRLLVICLLIVAANGLEIYDIATHKSQPRVACDVNHTVTLLQSNVYGYNYRQEKAAETLINLSKQADIMVLNEYNYRWRGHTFSEFSKEFPYRYLTSSDSQMPWIGIFSRFPFTVTERPGAVKSNGSLKVVFPTKGFNLFTYHGFTPIKAGWALERNRELEKIGYEVYRQERPAILTGDFNQTPYATRFARVADRDGIRFGPFPEGVEPSWPDSWITWPFLGIPIDHVLMNQRAFLCSRHLVDMPGADHRVSINELQFR